MDERTRSAWSRPELIVIVRGKPEESVLDVCKTGGLVGPVPTYAVCTEVMSGDQCNTDFNS